MKRQFSSALAAAALGGAGLAAHPAGAATDAASKSTAPSIVRIVKQDGGWPLRRKGEPYFVKGAVVGPGGSLDVLQQAGANSIRAHAGMLDEAERGGFTALVGLPLGNPRHGFDYSDTNKVEQQFSKARDLVRKYHQHPALSSGSEPGFHWPQPPTLDET